MQRSNKALIRYVALMNTHSHIILDALVGVYWKAETPLAETLLTKIPDHSITLFDRNFWSANLTHRLIAGGTQRHWLIPKRHNIVYEVIEEYGDGDALWRMKVSPQARQKNPNLSAYWDARAITYEVQGKPRTVLTSLPAQSIAQLYRQRWEIELGYP